MNKLLELLTGSAEPAPDVEPADHADPRTEMLERLLESGNVYAYIIDTEMRYIYLNRLALQAGYGGRPLEDVVGRRGRDFYVTDADGYSDLDLLEANDRQVLTTGRPIQVHEVLGGRVLYSQKWPMFDETGTIYAIGGISFDVTDVVAERVRGTGQDNELMVNMAASTSRLLKLAQRLA